jgi:ribosomal protein S18 acetylase RimI-like enzyme
MDKMHREAATIEHWYLWALGVSPEHQKKGLASKMLEAMLERIDKERLPCWLETNGDINESIYEKFRFEVVKRASALGEPGCIMLRYPC